MTRVLLASLLLGSAASAWAQEAPRETEKGEPPIIQDNSFLIEEAYNQEEGVVQHINTFARSEGAGWLYTFTQEWPLFSQKNQLSFTLPVQHIQASPGGSTGLGDLMINYRYQLVGDGNTAVALAPRITLTLPTGDEAKGRGAGASGLQANVPLSAVLSKGLVTHYNAGATLVPSAKDGFGASATTMSYNLGASIIWLARPSFNALVEALWFSSESAAGPGATDRAEEVFINPGVRWAFNFKSGLQIVPGIAYTIGVGPSEGDNSLFLYLSVEHGFKRVAQ